MKFGFILVFIMVNISQETSIYRTKVIEEKISKGVCIIRLSICQILIIFLQKRLPVA